MRENTHFTEQESNDDSVQKHSFSEDGPRLTFGIHSLTLGGTSPEFVGPPENLVCIQEALSQLQAKGQPFIARAYLPYKGAFSSTEKVENQLPLDITQCLSDGCKLDLALAFRDPDLEGWLHFIREAVKQYGPWLAKLQTVGAIVTYNRA